MRRAWHTAIALLASSARVNGPALTHWVLGYFPITLSIVAAGAATVSLIEHAHDARAPEGTAWLLAGAVALGLLAMIVIERSLVDAERLVSVYRALGMVLPVEAVAALVVGWVRRHRGSWRYTSRSARAEKTSGRHCWKASSGSRRA